MIKTKLTTTTLIAMLTVAMATLALAPAASAAVLPTAAHHTVSLGAPGAVTGTTNQVIPGLLARANALLAVASAGGPAGSAGAPGLVSAVIATATAILNGVVTVIGVTAVGLSGGFEPSSINTANATRQIETLASETAAFAHYAGLTGVAVGNTLSTLNTDLGLGIF